jgi:hypothetical protein
MYKSDAKRACTTEPDGIRAGTIGTLHSFVISCQILTMTAKNYRAHRIHLMDPGQTCRSR